MPPASAEMTLARNALTPEERHIQHAGEGCIFAVTRSTWLPDLQAVADDLHRGVQPNVLITSRTATLMGTTDNDAFLGSAFYRSPPRS